LLDEILKKGKSWIGFNSIVGFNPGKSLGPCLIFSLGFVGVVDERTCFEI